MYLKCVSEWQISRQLTLVCSVNRSRPRWYGWLRWTGSQRIWTWYTKTKTIRPLQNWLPNYDKTTQYTNIDNSTALAPDWIKLLHQVTGKFLFYARAVDNTMKHTLMTLPPVLTSSPPAMPQSTSSFMPLATQMLKSSTSPVIWSSKKVTSMLLIALIWKPEAAPVVTISLVMLTAHMDHKRVYWNLDWRLQKFWTHKTDYT